MTQQQSVLTISGDSVTQGPRKVAPRLTLSRAVDVVDADYEIVATPGRRANPLPLHAFQAEKSAAISASTGLAFLAREEKLKVSDHLASAGGAGFWAGVVALTGVVFWISGGHALFMGPSDDAFVPPAASPRGALTLSNITSRVDASGRRPVLHVDGVAGNDGQKMALLPSIEFRVTGNDGVMTRYRLVKSPQKLAPGEQFSFSSQMPPPRQGVRSVSVTFAE